VSDVVKVLQNDSAERGDRRHAPAAGSGAPKNDYRDPMQATDSEIEEALASCRWDIKKAAASLRMSRASFYMRIDRHPDLRKAADLGVEEIEAAYQECEGLLDRMVDRLHVSKTALKARMRSLGVPRTADRGDIE